MQPANRKIHPGFLSRLSDLIICSHCLRDGVKTPVVQVISHRHSLTSLCPACRRLLRPAPRRLPAPLLLF